MCQKSLIKESIKAKLEKLDDNISYEIDGKKIDIIVKRSRIEKKGLDDYSGENYDEYTVLIDGQKVLFKTYGYAGGGWRYWDTEEFELGEFKIENQMKTARDRDYCYIKDGYKVEKNTIWHTKTSFDVYKVEEDIVKGHWWTYYKPKENEYGFFVEKNLPKKIENPEENVVEQIKQIYDDYNAAGDEIFNSLIETLEKGVKEDTILPIDEEGYKKLKEDLKAILYGGLHEKDIKRIVKELNEIKRYKEIYDSIVSQKDRLHKEIDELNDLLDKCLDLAIQDMEGFEKELEAARKILSKKYNKKASN